MRLATLLAFIAASILAGCGAEKAPAADSSAKQPAASAAPAAAAAPTPQPAAPVVAATPDSFRVAFETSRGRIVLQIYRSWAPFGADRFRELVEQKFFDDNRFYRVIPGFMAQFGIAGEPKTNLPWDVKFLPDDSVKHTNARGTITFAAMQSPRSRNHQLFINTADNGRLDPLGFAPIGRVVEGMPVVDSIFSEYREQPQGAFIQTLGNSYLERMFPKLDYIKSAKILP